MSQNAASINTMMAKHVPELSSTFAAYPLNNSRWLFPQEAIPNGNRGFIASAGNTGLKPDYVYGRAQMGSGYYHLLTRASYQLLFNRFRSQAPPGGCCACDKATRKERDEYETVRRILYNRSIGSIPNDEVAAREAISGARQVAQGWHTGLQNEQLLIGGIQLATL